MNDKEKTNDDIFYEIYRIDEQKYQLHECISKIKYKFEKIK